ncbi:hypothetical protein TNCV_2514881 [Trichonephila clavipes]|nr:hypothetical protein TNCV_2514881 [Trichonephila clavipes]
MSEDLGLGECLEIIARHVVKIFEWHKRFSEDREVAEGDERSCRSVTPRIGDAHHSWHHRDLMSTLKRNSITSVEEVKVKIVTPQHCFEQWKIRTQLRIDWVEEYLESDSIVFLKANFED